MICHLFIKGTTYGMKYVGKVIAPLEWPVDSIKITLYYTRCTTPVLKEANSRRRTPPLEQGCSQ